MVSVGLASCSLDSEGAVAVADLIRVSGSLTECNIRGNHLDVESAKLLAKVAMEKRVMLFGIKHDQTKADFSFQNLKLPDAVLIANDISVSRSLTQVPASARTFISPDSASVSFHCAHCDV